MSIQSDSERSGPSVATQPRPAAPRPRRGVSKALFNFWVDVSLVVPILIVIWVTVMLRLVFPVPTAADGWTLWGLNYTQWSDVQFYALCVFVLLVLEHIVLHWNWVCGIITTKILRIKKKRPDEGAQAIYGVGAFITVLLLMMMTLLAAMLSVDEPKPAPVAQGIEQQVPKT